MSSAAAEPPSLGGSWWRRQRPGWRWVVVCAPVAVVAFFLIGFVPFVAVSASGRVTTTGTDCTIGCPVALISTQSLPSGKNMSLRWTDVSGGAVTFYVTSSVAGNVVFAQSGNGGAGYFPSLGGTYEFMATDGASSEPVNQSSQQVDYTVAYFTSLL